MTHSPTPCLSKLVIAGTVFASLFGQVAVAQEAFAVPGPTPQHELLKKEVGEWDAAGTMWLRPDAEPMKSQGRETNELLAGGLWLVSRFESTSDDMPFTGVGTFGYDPAEKEYICTWIDTMAPHLMVMKGSYDEATMTMTMMGEAHDPQTGKTYTAKRISRYTDDNTRSIEFHMPGPDGQYWKMMEIQYKRRPE